MSGSDDTRRIADEHAAFFSDHKGKDLRSWVEQHWAPDVRMTNGGERSSIPLEQWLNAHSADGGFDFDDCGIEVTKLIVDDGSFAMQVIITLSICGQGFANDPISRVPDPHGGERKSRGDRGFLRRQRSRAARAVHLAAVVGLRGPFSAVELDRNGVTP